jgi:hypothetical protein
MKFVRYNAISIYVNYVVEFKGRQVKVIWTTEDGIIEDNFETVFSDLSNDVYEDYQEQFFDELPSISLNMGEIENA